MKPWIQNFDSESKQVNVPGGYNHLAKFLQFWWDIFCEDVHPRLSSDMVCVSVVLCDFAYFNNLIIKLNYYTFDLT